MGPYTDAEKAEAVDLYVTDGPTAVQAQLRIPKGTVTKWAQAAGVETVSIEKTRSAVEAARLVWQQRRIELAHRIGLVAELALERAEQDLLDGRIAGKDAVLAMAILIDKAELLTSASTVRDAEPIPTVEEVSALAAELRERRRRSEATRLAAANDEEGGTNR